MRRDSVSAAIALPLTMTHDRRPLMAKKLARQPKTFCIRPPIIGATIGANALSDPIRDSSRAARTPE